jgi:glycosyltransferase involved in cell wall biosynthesis
MHSNSILFLTNAYPDFESSYRGVFIKKLALLLQEQGYQISIVTPKIYKGSHYFEQHEGIKVYRFPFFAGNKLLIEYTRIPYLRMVLYYTTGFFFTLYAILKSKCNMLHVHWAIPTGLIAVWVRVLFKRPFIVTTHGSDLRMALGRSGFLRKIFLYVCRSANYINCVSEAQKRELERLGFADEKISTIPMGIDEGFLEAGKKRKMALNKRPFTILSNRNLLPIYNVSSLIRAIPIILGEETDVRFLIAGDGSERGRLEKEVNDLSITEYVEFLGRVSHDKMPNLLARSDIYVSTSYYDGTSVSLLEALASGAFPVVTDIPSNREWIADGDNGFLVPKENEILLAKKIVDAIRNRKLVEEACERNQQIAQQRACWKGNTEKIRELYNFE